MSSKSVVSSVLPELFRFSLYKPAQGRLVRQSTFICLVLVAAFGCFSLSNGSLGDKQQAVRVGVPLAVWALLSWFAFRAIHVPRFAEFMIAVDVEREKVVWPGRQQVVQSTVVVIVVMLAMGAFLAGVDLIWKWLFRLIHFIEY